MNCEKVIHERFIEPLWSKKTGNIGIELEFPMLNMAKSPVDKKIALGLLEMLCKNGFSVEEKDIDGNPAFVTDVNGDCVSFDNSYNNIEFSMNYGDNLLKIKDRFLKNLNLAQIFLKKHNYLITGMGTNPYKKYINQSHVSYPVYNMVDEYLHKFSCEETHIYPDFPAYLSSVQTHLDVCPEDLPKTATLFAKIDFLRCLLFANSPDFEFSGTLCYRDYLWHKSAFGICGSNTGPVDEEYESLDDIAKSFYNRAMFNNVRDGKYTTFTPIKIDKYFENNPASDINQFLSFRHIEITCRGTLEIRSDCTQPIREALLPPAFNLGISHNVDKAIKRTNILFENKNIDNSYLRNCAATGTKINEFSKETIVQYALDMSEISKEGLLKRGKGEQILLEPIFARAKNLICPAIHTLENKDNIEKIITEYSK